jgi:gas vesicle protein GvpG
MILFKLLALPITAPAAGIRYCIEKVVEFAEHEMTDDEPVRIQLMELQLELEEGRVSEDEYAEREAVLLARLREIREYRKQMASEAAQASDPGVGAPLPGETRRAVIEVPEELE